MIEPEYRPSGSWCSECGLRVRWWQRAYYHKIHGWFHKKKCLDARLERII